MLQKKMGADYILLIQSLFDQGFLKEIEEFIEYAHKKELDYYLKVYAGRPTPLYYAKNLSEKIGGAKIDLAV